MEIQDPEKQQAVPTTRVQAPPDQKMIDALLATTRAENDHIFQQKAEQQYKNANLLSKIFNTFNPEYLDASPQARRKALMTAIILASSLIIIYAIVKNTI